MNNRDNTGRPIIIPAAMADYIRTVEARIRNSGENAADIENLAYCVSIILSAKASDNPLTSHMEICNNPDLSHSGIQKQQPERSAKC